MKRHTGKTAWQKLLAMTLISMFLLELFSPLSIQPAYAVGTYGKATGNGVNVRKQPNTKSPPWFQIDQGYVCPVEDITTIEITAFFLLQGNSLFDFAFFAHVTPRRCPP